MIFLRFLGTPNARSPIARFGESGGSVVCKGRAAMSPHGGGGGAASGCCRRRRVGARARAAAAAAWDIFTAAGSVVLFLVDLAALLHGEAVLGDCCTALLLLGGMSSPHSCRHQARKEDK
jgi:hypothetical protein